MPYFQTAFSVCSLLLLACAIGQHPVAAQNDSADKIARYLYVATPGIRNDLAVGGAGILKFDIDQNFKCVQRMPSAALLAFSRS